MSILGWSGSPQDARADEAAMLPVSQDQREGRPHLEVRTAQALARIWHRFVEPDQSDEQQPESSASTVKKPHADHVGGIRLLIEELQNDPEFADALRDSLAKSLRKVANDYARRPLSDAAPENSQPQLFQTGDYDKAPNQASVSRQTRQAVLALQANHSDLASSLEEVEHLIRSLQLSQLKVTVALYLTSPGAPVMSSAIIRSSVEVADSLERLRKVAREVSTNAELVLERKHDSSGRTAPLDEIPRTIENLREATRQLSQSTENLRSQVQRIVEDRLASGREQSNSGVFLNIGEMLHLGPRLTHSEFDPRLQTAFGSAGDLLTRSLLSRWQPSEEPQDVYSSV